MSAILSITHQTFGVSQLENPDRPVTELYSELVTDWDTLGVPPEHRFSVSSFRRMLNESSFKPVKGWHPSICDQATVNALRAARNASKRDEKRASRKLHKKAKKAAERSLQNGDRNFLKSQKSKAQKRGPQLNALTRAMFR